METGTNGWDGQTPALTVHTHTYILGTRTRTSVLVNPLQYTYTGLVALTNDFLVIAVDWDAENVPNTFIQLQ